MSHSLLLTPGVHGLYTFWEDHFGGKQKVWTFLGPVNSGSESKLPADHFFFRAAQLGANKVDAEAPAAAAGHRGGLRAHLARAGPRGIAKEPASRGAAWAGGASPAMPRAAGNEESRSPPLETCCSTAIGVL